jgi:predicted glutamine amidotransferase
MCGLLGCIGNTVLNEEFKIKFTKIFTDIENRGKDGTGIYIPNKIVKGITLYLNLLKLKNTTISLTEQQFVYLGHVRKATTGSTDVTEKEAHPFYSNHTVLIHNWYN